MELIAALVVVVILCAIFSGGGRKWQTSERDRADHRRDGDSHIYYYNRHDELVHESEGCNDCMASYARRLRERGVRVDEVILGRRNSGDLNW